MKTSLLAIALAASVGVTATPAGAQNQSLAALNTIIGEVDFQGVGAQQAFEWLSAAAGFNLVISWNRLEAEGYDRNTPVTLQLRTVPAITVLRLLASEVFTSRDVIIEVDPAYVRVLTRRQATDEPVVKVYDIADLLHEAPDFDTAPQLDLNQIVSDSQSDAGGGGVFGNDPLDEEPRLSRSERAEQIAQVIRSNIEPDLWFQNGGNAARITYYNGQLIIRAPEHVHRKIGMPAVDTRRRAQHGGAIGPRHSTYRDSRPYRYAGPRYDRYSRGYTRSMSNGVSGIDRR